MRIKTINFNLNGETRTFVFTLRMVTVMVRSLDALAP